MEDERLPFRLHEFMEKAEMGEGLDNYGYGEVYRASMWSEKQKFLNDSKAREWLQEHEPGLEREERDQMVKESGFSFTKTKDRAFNAIQRLLDSEKARPNGKVASQVFNGEFNEIVLEINYADYYEAFGLTRNDGSFTGSQVNSARQALTSLEEDKRRIIYERQDEHEEALINTRKPLINTEEAGSKIKIHPSPLFIDQIESFSLFKPINLHEEIKTWRGTGSNYPKSVPNFLQWLNTVDFFPTEIKEQNLVEKVGLATYREQSHYRTLNEYLRQAVKAAMGLEFLLDWEFDGEKYSFYLNPLRCSRYGYKLTESQYQRKSFSKYLENIYTGGGVETNFHFSGEGVSV